MIQKSYKKIVPIKMDKKILKIIDTDHYNIEHSWDMSSLISLCFPCGKIQRRSEQKITAIKNKVIKQLSQRNSTLVYELWQELNIDRETVAFFMDIFGLIGSDNVVYNKIIPSDSAEIFLRFRYGLYPWEDIGKEFGIFTYVWLYGFFFPEQIFEIPQPKLVTEVQQKYFKLNYDFCRCKMTMEHIIKMILLYQDSKRAKSIFFEPDLPLRNSEIKCNLAWKERLQVSL